MAGPAPATLVTPARGRAACASGASAGIGVAGTPLVGILHALAAVWLARAVTYRLR